ncbi:EF-hand domain-containing protein [Parvibaculum sp.]|uniref:EF-hand domain-containing protein n=1 Tax=Parvibaculum sp. TaxID=2024848 RepID=UPI000EB95233|nr:EF-hand domain-containing protein [Parvibaculum sp.]MBO6667188.1 EF-hand domain-containing protein [Parvibaculum sp.]MBO6690819.1 EF-hand domain-containing protein [Parvibaculum sp.]MBO6713741.1 EF-hand domain-containing protein [Parvibaculum sp.]HAC60269.1 hypothetical protein [Rhodobiaceae bacterium]
MRILKFGLLGTSAALALAIALPVISHAGPGKGGHGARLFEQADTNGDGSVSMAEMQAASEERFAGADADGDGVLTKDEMRSAHENMRREYRGDPAERFAAADADGDGRITLEEMKTAAAGRRAGHMERFFKAADTDGDGGLTQEEMQAARDKMQKRFAEHKGKRGDHFSRIDADGDGQVTKAEFVAAGEKMFDRLDANDDGKLEPGEGRPHRGGPDAN